MKKKFLRIIAGMIMIVGAMFPAQAFAGSCGGVSLFGLDSWYAELECDGGEISESNFKSSNLTGTVIKIIGTIVKDLMFVAGILAVGLMMYGGFLMITSAGSPAAVEKAKKTISGSIIGLVIAIVAYAIVTAVFKLTSTGSIS
ncbi:hypothetical protein IKG20_02455 [Candidatus Saccharibacteria bacterium]|nr:hypothetical protein [Candidatus Saccharibacteria bacterium]